MGKKLFTFMVMALLLVIFAACGKNDTGSTPSNATPDSADEEKPSYTFKLGHEAAPSHIKYPVAEKFAEELEQATDGRMKVDIYPGAQLGKEKEMAQLLETGSIDFAILSNGTMSSRLESLNGWFMPFLFDSLEDAAKARDSTAAKQMLIELESQNIVGFDVFFAGMRHVLSKTEVNGIDDLKGIKIRIPGSPVFESYWGKVGAGSVSMPLPEVYTSLFTGVIDAVDTDLDALISQKFYEAAEHVILTNHIVFPEVVLGSKATFDSLDEEDQQIIRDVWASVIEWGVQESIALENSRIEELKGLGMNVKTLEDTTALQEVIDKVYEEYSTNETIKAFIQAHQK